VTLFSEVNGIRPVRVGCVLCAGKADAPRPTLGTAKAKVAFYRENTLAAPKQKREKKKKIQDTGLKNKHDCPKYAF
jgi:hypothetical protein